MRYKDEKTFESIGEWVTQYPRSFGLVFGIALHELAMALWHIF